MNTEHSGQKNYIEEVYWNALNVHDLTFAIFPSFINFYFLKNPGEGAFAGPPPPAII
jgi:hypothetical protein